MKYKSLLALAIVPFILTGCIGHSKEPELAPEELSKSYNTRHPHATKGTKVYEHGQGRERVNLFNKEKNEIISVKLDRSDVMRTALKEHGITGKTADMLMEDINKKLSEPQKAVFNYTKEKTEVVYADIPNIGEYLAHSHCQNLISQESEVLSLSAEYLRF